MQSLRQSVVSVTGMFRHVGLWVTSSSGDLFYSNPDFIPKAAKEELSGEGQSAGVAVYCIHGTGDRVSAFTLIAERSKGKMPPTISGFHLISFDNRGKGCSIEEFANQLAEKILANGDRDVILIGHSRGGLVAAFLTEYLAQKFDIRVRAVVAIAAPFGGSHLALPPLTWVSESVKEMQPNSEFLENLTEKIIISESDYFYFAAPNDAIVKENSTYVDGKGVLTVLDTGHGHLSMLSSHQLVEKLNACLWQVTTAEKEREQEWIDNDESDDEIELDAFTIVHVATPLEMACEKIMNEIENLQQRYHLWPAHGKISVLSKLYERLFALMDGERGHDYPDTQTVGDFIAAFMQDQSNGDGKKPIDILSAPLNGINGYTFSSLLGYGAAPQSATFVDELIASLQDDPLPGGNGNVLADNMNRSL